jgi:hypothetical protein
VAALQRRCDVRGPRNLTRAPEACPHVPPPCWGCPHVTPPCWGCPHVAPPCWGCPHVAPPATPHTMFPVAEVFPDMYLHIGGDEVEYECWKVHPRECAPV